MAVEIIPRIAAVLLAAICAGTDFVWGKIFNKVLSRGLLFAVAWLTFTGIWSAFGGLTAMDEFPALGMWKAPPKPVAASIFQGVRDGPGAWNSEAPVSVLPTNDEEWREAEQAQRALANEDSSDPAAALKAAPPAPTPHWWIYAAKMAINAITALIIGLLLWWFGMWAAGDAKLFGVLVAIIPLSSYSASYWPIFPAYVLIFNSFVALLAILVGELVVRFARTLFTRSDADRETWKTALNWVKDHRLDIVRAFFGFLFFMLVIKALRMLTQDIIGLFAKIDSGTLMYVILFLIFQPLVKLMRKRWVMITMIAFTVGFTAHAAIFPTESHNVLNIVRMSGLMLGIVAFLIVYQFYLNVFDFRPVRIWELRPQMVLARKTIDTLKEDGDMLAHKMGPINPDGISRQQVDVLRRWWIDRGKGGSIWVSRTIPFAPALFIGTLLTVILSGYIFKINQ